MTDAVSSKSRRLFLPVYVGASPDDEVDSEDTAMSTNTANAFSLRQTRSRPSSLASASGAMG